MDFGGLGAIRKWLAYYFDHTFLAAEDDPHLESFRRLDEQGIIQLRILPRTSMESTAAFVYGHAEKIICELTQGRVWISKVEVRENECNSAFLSPLAPRKNNADAGKKYSWPWGESYLL